MPTLLRVLGVVMVVLGLLWALQGSGLFPYPAQSPMLGQTRWLGIGIVLAVLGVVVLGGARRMGGPR